MLCKKCGAQLADDAKFCPLCNEPTEQPAQPAQFAQPQYAQYNHPATQSKLSRSKFFLKKAPTNWKVINLVSVLIGLLCALLIFIPTYRAFNASILDYPLMKLLGDEEFRELGEEYDELLEELEEADEDGYLKEAFEIELGMPFKDLERKHNITYDEFINLFEPLSINNLTRLLEIIEPGSETDEVVDILKVVKVVMYTCCAFLMIITVIGALLQKTWVMVLAYILSILFVFVNGGVLFFILTSITYITAAVLYSKLKKMYKAYLAAPEA